MKFFLGKEILVVSKELGLRDIAMHTFSCDITKGSGR